MRVFNANGSHRFDFFAYEESYKEGRIAIGDANGEGVDDLLAGREPVADRGSGSTTARRQLGAI